MSLMFTGEEEEEEEAGGYFHSNKPERKSAPPTTHTHTHTHTHTPGSVHTGGGVVSSPATRFSPVRKTNESKRPDIVQVTLRFRPALLSVCSSTQAPRTCAHMHAERERRGRVEGMRAVTIMLTVHVRVRFYVPCVAGNIQLSWRDPRARAPPNWSWSIVVSIKIDLLLIIDHMLSQTLINIKLVTRRW